MEETCRQCTFYRSSRDVIYSKRRNGAGGSGVCTCWAVKGRNGDYLKVSGHKKACEHYMPEAMMINLME